MLRFWDVTGLPSPGEGEETTKESDAQTPAAGDFKSGLVREAGCSPEKQCHLLLT